MILIITEMQYYCDSSFCRTSCPCSWVFSRVVPCVEVCLSVWFLLLLPFSLKPYTLPLFNKNPAPAMEEHSKWVRLCTEVLNRVRMGVTVFFLLFSFPCYSLLHGSYLSVYSNSGHTHLFTAPPTPLRLALQHINSFCVCTGCLWAWQSKVDWME